MSNPEGSTPRSASSSSSASLSAVQSFVVTTIGITGFYRPGRRATSETGTGGEPLEQRRTVPAASSTLREPLFDGADRAAPLEVGPGPRRHRGVVVGPG